MASYLAPLIGMSNTVAQNPILDEEFLDKLYHTVTRFTYARVVALNYEEEPLEYLEGRITSGTVNVDGKSAVRRTINLSMIAEEVNIHEYYWGLKTKVQIFAGLQNDIDDRYPDIIWFKQGTFVLTSFNTTQGLANYTISLQGKDKMVLLNGELGGVVTSLTWDFGTVKVTSADGYNYDEKLLLKDIVIDSVHQFAKMPFYKIHVNDLDDMGLELLEYRGKDPLYCIKTTDNQCNMTMNGDMELLKDPNLQDVASNRVKLKDIAYYDPMFDLESRGVVPISTLYTRSDKTECTVAKLTYGMTAGYRLTDLTYAGDLILNVGDTITSLLDKIVQMLGNYEYFFDLDGQFVFQRKQIYLNTTFNGIQKNEENEEWVNPNAHSSDITYSFTDAQLITNYQNAPNLQNIKNDFSIWGTRKGVSGADIPVHMRFAIDDKPFEYISYDNIKYTTLSLTQEQQRQEVLARLNLTQEEYEALIQDHLLSNTDSRYWELLNYTTNRPTNKNGLPQEWWDIAQWAALWQFTVGYIPSGNMGIYCKKGLVGNYGQYFSGGSQLTGAVKLIHLDSNLTVKSTQHSYNCSHPYESYWLPKLAEGDIVYIYDPDLPAEIQSIIDLISEEALEEAEQELIHTALYCDLDWREIIYQMAQDFRKHHTEDDFYITIRQNNPDTCPTGQTGYEQYYTDLDGFWRQLYNPFYDCHYEQVGMSQRKYQVAIDEWYAAKWTRANSYTFPYYYAAPKYTQCEKGSIWYKNMVYYTHETDSDEFKPVKNLNQLQFEHNPTLYWFIDSNDNRTYEDCVITEKFTDSKYWFHANIQARNNVDHWQWAYGALQATDLYTKIGNSIGDKLDDSQYRILTAAYASNNEISKSWVKLDKVWAVPCFKSEEIKSYRTYYYYDENGKVAKTTGAKIDSVEFYNHPTKYWRYIDTYRKCTAQDPYDSDVDYYVKGQAARTDEDVYTVSKQVTEERYQSAIDTNDPAKYYVIDQPHVQVPCYEYQKPDDLAYLLCYTNSSQFAVDNLSVDTVADVMQNNKGTVENNQQSLRTILGNDYETTEFVRFNAPNRVNQTIAQREAALDTKIQELSNEHLIWAIYGRMVPVVHPLDYNGDNSYFEKRTDAYRVDHWVPDVAYAPDCLNFWFDFLDEPGELGKYSNAVIGNRPKAVNDNNVKAIYFRETPTVIFTDGSTETDKAKEKLGYSYVNLQTNLLSLFSISRQGKSAKTVLDQFLYDYACCAEQITFNTLPYYHLEPNKRIFVSCPESGITGEYIMTNFSVPLGPATSMSITATKAIQSLY